MGNTEGNSPSRRFAALNIYALRLQLIRMQMSDHVLLSVLDTLGSAITDCGATIREAEDCGNQEYLDVVAEDECEVVENLLGVAFVMCQVMISGVVSGVFRLQKDAKSKGHVLPTCSKGKGKQRRNCLLRLGSPLTKHPECTEVEVIDIFADFFKHRIGRHSSNSKAIISKVVAFKDCTHVDMHRAAEALGITDYKNLGPLGDMVSKWVAEVIAKYESELKDLNLI